MNLTNEQERELREAAMPLMQWLRSNCHPHVTAIVDSELIQLLEGVTTARREPHPDYREYPNLTSR